MQFEFLNAYRNHDKYSGKSLHVCFCSQRLKSFMRIWILKESLQWKVLQQAVTHKGITKAFKVHPTNLIWDLKLIPLMPIIECLFLRKVRSKVLLPGPLHTTTHQLHVVLVEQWYDLREIGGCKKFRHEELNEQSCIIIEKSKKLPQFLYLYFCEGQYPVLRCKQ